MKKKIQFRTLTEQDLPELAVILSSELICQHTPFGPNTFQETENYFKPLIKSQTDSKAYKNYIIAIVDNNRVIGNIGVFKKKENKNNYEIGYNLAEEYWNKGIMTKAVNRICYILIEKKKAKKITATVMSSNLASLKVLEKNGFKMNQINFNTIEKNGCKYDEIMMQLTILN